MKRIPPGALVLAFSCLAVAPTATAGNPFVTDVYTADPSVLVHDDVVYLYTGHDEATEQDTDYRMNEWLCFSSLDLVHWTAHGSPLRVSDFSWALSSAFAGDLVERAGKYYWYVPMTHRTIPGFAIGVAVSDSPFGPFRDARGSALITNAMTTDISLSWDDIDPKAFVDSDGQAYLFWGNTRCRYVKLKENMVETEGPIMTVSGLTNYTEAPWVHKRGDIYYLSYAARWPEKFAYATSDKITGPWTYRGEFKDYAENSNTNHGAIFDFKGRSYLIYHNGALPKGGSYRRSVCGEVLEYNPDGTIRPMLETKTGFSAAPVVTARPSNEPVQLGGSARLLASASGTGDLMYQWYRNRIALAGQTSETLQLWNVQTGDLGVYDVVVSDRDGGIARATTTLAAGAPGRLANLSVRSTAGSGSETLIVGFVVAGTSGKPVLVRSSGPTLAAFDVSGYLPDPRLTLYRDQTVIGANDDWGTNSNASEIIARGGDRIGAVALGSREAALLPVLEEGGYTAHAAGAPGTTGTALVEVYDTDPSAPGSAGFEAQPRLVNLSARSQVGSGNNLLIAGFVVNGDVPRRLLIRATGPTLKKFGVGGVLADPELQLYREQTVIAENKDWGAAPNVADVFLVNGAKLDTFTLDAHEAVLVVSVPPGAYTAQVRGANGGTGVALVEVYELP